MKNIFKLTLAAALVASSAGVSHADLTYQGAVGLPLNPTAQLPAQGGARVQLNYNDAGDSFVGIEGLDYKLGGLAAAARLGSSRFEINGVIQQGDLDLQGESEKNTGFGVGLKYLISRETEDAGVRLAVGAGYNDIPLGFDEFELKNTYAYFVATKSLSAIEEGKAPITGHLGLRWDDFEAEGEIGSISDDKFSVFAGVEVPVTRDGQFQIVGEAQSKNIDGGKSPYSIGVRYRPAGKPFGASIGLQRQGLGDSGLYLQAGYTFGG